MIPRRENPWHLFYYTQIVMKLVVINIPIIIIKPQLRTIKQKKKERLMRHRAKNRFYISCETTKHVFVLVTYLQFFIDSTVSKGKIHSFHKSHKEKGKQKTKTAHPNHKSAINTCCVFQNRARACSGKTRFLFCHLLDLTKKKKIYPTASLH